MALSWWSFWRIRERETLRVGENVPMVERHSSLLFNGIMAFMAGVYFASLSFSFGVHPHCIRRHSCRGTIVLSMSMSIE
jgi:hypothetical protein